MAKQSVLYRGPTIFEIIKNTQSLNQFIKRNLRSVYTNILKIFRFQLTLRSIENQMTKLKCVLKEPNISIEISSIDIKMKYILFELRIFLF